MTSPIGKLLLQHTKLPQDVIQYCIEPCFGVTEEEVRNNRKKLMMELIWVLNLEKYVRTYFGVSKAFPRYQNVLFRYRNILLNSDNRKLMIRTIESVHFLELPDFESALKHQKIKRSNQFVATLPSPRVEIRSLKPRSWIAKLFCFNPTFINRIKVNLKTKEVVMYRYY